jgi:hypothetical protein
VYSVARSPGTLRKHQAQAAAREPGTHPLTTQDLVRWKQAVACAQSRPLVSSRPGAVLLARRPARLGERVAAGCARPDPESTADPSKPSRPPESAPSFRHAMLQHLGFAAACAAGGALAASGAPLHSSFLLLSSRATFSAAFCLLLRNRRPPMNKNEMLWLWKYWMVLLFVLCTSMGSIYQTHG